MEPLTTTNADGAERPRKYKHRTKRRACRFCGERFWPQGIKRHENACAMNPANGGTPSRRETKQESPSGLFALVSTHIPVEQMERLKGAADADGVSVAEWLRTLISIGLD